MLCLIKSHPDLFCYSFVSDHLLASKTGVPCDHRWQRCWEQDSNLHEQQAQVSSYCFPEVLLLTSRQMDCTVEQSSSADSRHSCAEAVCNSSAITSEKWIQNRVSCLSHQHGRILTCFILIRFWWCICVNKMLLNSDVSGARGGKVLVQYECK